VCPQEERISTIWLIYPYGGLPTDGFFLDRPALLAEALAAAGHQVTWWVSAMDHRTKQHRVTQHTTQRISENFKIHIVPTTLYKKNISLARIRAEVNYGAGILQWSRNEPPPDVIVMLDPLAFFWGSVRRILRRTGAALVIDRVDLWPELFHLALPRFLRRLGKQIFAPLYTQRASAFARADGLLGVSHDYTMKGWALAPHLPAERVRCVYWGVNVTQLRSTMVEGQVPEVVRAARVPGEIRIVFASTLGNMYDVPTVLAAAKELVNRGVKFQLFIIGSGPMASIVADFVAQPGIEQVHFLGSLGAVSLASVYAHCDIGIAAYVAGSTVSLPIKAFHLSAAGLAVVNSLPGEYAELLEKSGAGIPYEPGSASSLAAAIMKYSSNNTFLASTRKASFKLAADFDTATLYPQAVEIVERAMHSRRPASAKA
jgi:glycosyltransferase involved in cell wall biosynthesis